MQRRFTMLDSLAVISLGLILGACVPPWMLKQTSSTRTATCQNNLRQFGIGLMIFGERDASKRFCTGAMDLASDGCPDVKSWIGNLIGLGAGTAGKMLCPTNDARGNENLNQLIGGDVRWAIKTTRYGVKAEDITKGFCKDFEITVNPVVGIYEANPTSPLKLPGTFTNGSAERLKVVQKAVQDGYNTNYAQSWFMARAHLREVRGSERNLQSEDAAGKIYTRGNAKDLSGALAGVAVRFIEKAPVATSAVPMLGDGAVSLEPTAVLTHDLDKTLRMGSRLVASYGNGASAVFANEKVKQTLLQVNCWTNGGMDMERTGEPAGDPLFAAGDLPISVKATGGSQLTAFLDDTLPLPDEEGFGGVDIIVAGNSDGATDKLNSEPGGYGGADGNLFLQDTRMFAAVHGSGKTKQCNILFADTSVKSLIDTNGDGYINPGFPIDTSLDQDTLKSRVGYTNRRSEVSPADMFNGPILDFPLIKCAAFNEFDEIELRSQQTSPVPDTK